MVLSGDFNFIIQYAACPFIGAILALVFYEFVFVKSQEYLAADEEEEDEDGTSLKDGIEVSPPSKKRLVHNIDIEEDEATEL